MYWSFTYLFPRWKFVKVKGLFWFILEAYPQVAYNIGEIQTWYDFSTVTVS